MQCYNNTRPTYNPATKKCTATDGVTVGDCFSGSPGGNDSTNDYCIIYPKIFNIKVGQYNTILGTIFVRGGDYVGLKFNSKIDPDQLPLVEYIIDWDGILLEHIITATHKNSQNLYDRPNENSPHSFKTYFSYSAIQKEDALAGTNLCNAGRCELTPTIRIEDNWGAFKEILSPVTIIVTEN